MIENTQIASFLIDPTKATERSQARDGLAITTTVASVASVASVCFSALGALMWPSHTTIGSLIIVTGALMTVAARDANKISGNLDNLLASNIDRGRAAISIDFFVDKALEGTWLVQHACGPLAKRYLAKN